MTNNQQMAGEDRAMQKLTRRPMQGIKGAGSAAMHLGGGARPELQRGLPERHTSASVGTRRPLGQSVTLRPRVPACAPHGGHRYSLAGSHHGARARARCSPTCNSNRNSAPHREPPSAISLSIRCCERFATRRSALMCGPPADQMGGRPFTRRTAGHVGASRRTSRVRLCKPHTGGCPAYNPLPHCRGAGWAPMPTVLLRCGHLGLPVCSGPRLQYSSQ